MQVQQQVSDDELPVISRDEVGRAGNQQRLHQAPPGLQRVSLCGETPTDTVPFHHLLQDRVHLLGEYTREQTWGNVRGKQLSSNFYCQWIHYSIIGIENTALNCITALSPPLTGVSVQWLPFLAGHSPQQPTLYEATVRKIRKWHRTKSVEDRSKHNPALHKKKMQQYKSWFSNCKPTLTLHTVCPCSLTCSQLAITCSIWVRSKKSNCSSSGKSWLKSMASSTLSNFLRTDNVKQEQQNNKGQTSVMTWAWRDFVCIQLQIFDLNVIWKALRTFRSCVKMQEPAG